MEKIESHLSPFSPTAQRGAVSGRVRRRRARHRSIVGGEGTLARGAAGIQGRGGKIISGEPAGARDAISHPLVHERRLHVGDVRGGAERSRARASGHLRRLAGPDDHRRGAHAGMAAARNRICIHVRKGY